MSVCHFDFYHVNVMRKKIAVSVSGVSACYEQCFNHRLFTGAVKIKDQDHACPRGWRNIVTEHKTT